MIIEVYSEGARIRRTLKESGYTFTEEDFLNGFWGVRFTINRPRGKGATQRLKFLGDLK